MYVVSVKEITVCIGTLQCSIGWYSASGASSCTACSAGKYLTNAAGGTEAASCTSVSFNKSLHQSVCIIGILNDDVFFSVMQGGSQSVVHQAA